MTPADRERVEIHISTLDGCCCKCDETAAALRALLAERDYLASSVDFTGVDIGGAVPDGAASIIGPDGRGYADGGSVRNSEAAPSDPMTEYAERERLAKVCDNEVDAMPAFDCPDEERAWAHDFAAIARVLRGGTAREET